MQRCVEPQPQRGFAPICSSVHPSVHPSGHTQVRGVGVGVGFSSWICAGAKDMHSHVPLPRAATAAHLDRAILSTQTDEAQSVLLKGLRANKHQQIYTQ